VAARNRAVTVKKTKTGGFRTNCVEDAPEYSCNIQLQTNTRSLHAKIDRLRERSTIIDRGEVWRVFIKTRCLRSPVDARGAKGLEKEVGLLGKNMKDYSQTERA